ncbi:MAG: hypothetical protein ACSLFP_13395 [Acidimicrobiales bacterium]
MSIPSELAALTDELATLRQQVEAQAAELAQLRAAATPEQHRVSRRHLLTGLAGLGAAGAAGIATATPAAADDGDPLVLGQDNVATSTTVITTNTSQETEVRFGESFFAIAATSPSTAITGEIPDQGLAGVWGRATGATGFGLLGTADVAGGFGVAARSEAGPAILAHSVVDGVTLHLGPAERTGPPTAMPAGLAEYQPGSITFDDAGDLWTCVEGGAPGTWTRLLREDTAPGRVVPISPIRALDTRAPGGRASGAPAIPGQRSGALRGGQSITIDPAGVGPIPASATGLVGNATIITPSGTGFLRILPAGATTPASSFDFTTGVNVSNAFTTGITATGLTAIAPAASSTRYHLVIDLAAYIT